MNQITRLGLIGGLISIHTFCFCNINSVSAQTNTNADTAGSPASLKSLRGEFATNCSDEYFGPISQDEFTRLEQKASAGDPQAQYDVGARYAEGQGVKPNSIAAYRWLAQSAQLGYAKAQRRLGEMLLTGGGNSQSDSNQWLTLLTQAAEKGDDQAQMDLGSLYFQGRAIEKNYGKALFWFLKLADRGCSLAQNMVGMMYLLGQGVVKDSEAARGWLEKAAAQSNAEALRNLGILYYKGVDVSPDQKEGFKYLLKSAELGDAVSQTEVGKIYGTGNGVKTNLSEAISWFERASQNGNPDALRHLAFAYLNGIGVLKNTEKAKTLLKTAAKGGYADAQIDLGVLYLSGDDIKADYERAYIWMSAAAAQGNAAAEFNLGVMYHQGVGVPKDDVEALKWSLLSAAQEYEKATLLQEEVSAQIDRQQKDEARRRASLFKPQTDRPFRVDDFTTVTGALTEGFQINVNMFGEDKIMLVDTGSDGTYVDVKYKSFLGEPMALARQTAMLSNGETSTLYHSPEINFGKIRITPDLTGCMSLEIERIATGERCDGILGMNCLSNYVVQFDLDKDNISIGGSVPEWIRKNAPAIPLKKEAQSHLLSMEAVINGRESMRLVIDSGDMNSIDLNEQDWARIFGKGETNVPTKTLIERDGQIILKSKSARLQSLVVGTNCYTNLIAELFIGQKLPSRIGQLFIRRHLMTVDFPNQTLYLMPGRRFADTDDRDMSGINILKTNGQLMVDSVYEDSPAFRAGVKANDQVISIDGQDAKLLSLNAVRDLLCKEDGLETTLAIIRAGSVEHITFHLKRVF